MKRDQSGFGTPTILIVILIAGLIGGIGWYVYSKNNDSEPKTVTVVKKNSTKKSTAKSTSPTTSIPDSLKENVAAAIESQNTAALEGYLADSVTVVIAASEKGGSVDKTQAISDLNYLKNATSPWDFNLTEATLNAYKNGFYKDYFGDMTIVGKSSDNYVVSFHVDSNGKLDQIFMSVNADLLV